jgi:two-component system, cell cycle response regulator DivK
MIDHNMAGVQRIKARILATRRDDLLEVLVVYCAVSGAVCDQVAQRLATLTEEAQLSRLHRTALQSAQLEDNPQNWRLAQFLLKSQGDTVYAATTGEEALKLARPHLPGLICMDLQLPGMNGYAVTQRLKADAATAAIPVVALTAYAMPRHQDKTLATDCTRWYRQRVFYCCFKRVSTSISVYSSMV